MDKVGRVWSTMMMATIGDDDD